MARKNRRLQLKLAKFSINPDRYNPRWLCADCNTWIERDDNHNCRKSGRSRRRNGNGGR